MTKKRKDPPQATTLHHFFSANSESCDAKNKKRARATDTVKSTPQAVIVLDSDEEVETQLGGARLAKAELELSSDVEVIDLKPSKQLLKSQNIERTILKETSISPQTSGSKVFHPVRAGSLSLGSKNDENTFVARRSSISRDSVPRESPQYEVKNNKAEPVADVSELRRKFYEESESPEPIHISQEGPNAGAISPSTVAKSEAFDDFYDAPMDWDVNMGDDELDYIPYDELPPEDSCEDISIQLAEESPEGERLHIDDDDSATGSCPMCGLTFIDMDTSDKDAHVNSCLNDTKQAPIEPIASSSSAAKLLKPLSSFFSTSKSSPKLPSKSSISNVFSALMTSHSERAAWEEAQKNEDRNFKPTKTNRRKAPFYKVLQGMPIAVDAFRYGAIPGITAYFLTHAHSDHYTNLSANWKNGLIYCSETTANLVIHMLSVDKKWVYPLPMNTATTIPDTGGVKVTLIDANHCPGSCLFLFEGPQTVNAGDSTYKSSFVGSSRIFRYLHCGDFRACPQHVLHPAVKGKRVDHVYLDTTYLNPKYCFPPQPLVISACAELARRVVHGEPTNAGDAKASKGSIAGWVKQEECATDKGKGKLSGSDEVLVVVGTYSIGKERIVKAIAQALKTRVYCDGRKAAILRCQADPELHALLTSDPHAAGVHVVPLGMVASDRIADYLDRWKGRWSKLVAFRPTGWTFSAPAGTDTTPPVASVLARAQAFSGYTYAHLRPTRNSTARLMQYGVPYSEHSSFVELTCFALSLDWSRMIATVNVGSANSRGKIQKWVERWEAERKRRKNAGDADIVKFRAVDYW